MEKEKHPQLVLIEEIYELLNNVTNLAKINYKYSCTFDLEKQNEIEDMSCVFLMTKDGDDEDDDFELSIDCRYAHNLDCVYKREHYYCDEEQYANGKSLVFSSVVIPMLKFFPEEYRIELLNLFKLELNELLITMV